MGKQKEDKVYYYEFDTELSNGDPDTLTVSFKIENGKINSYKIVHHMVIILDEKQHKYILKELNEYAVKMKLI